MVSRFFFSALPLASHYQFHMLKASDQNAVSISEVFVPVISTWTVQVPGGSQR